MDSNYVVVEGIQTRMPSPSTPNPSRKAGSFPLIFTVRSLHPSPNPNSSFFSVLRYKIVHEFRINCDDFSTATVDQLVDLMNVPFPLHSVPLFWKSTVRSENPVPNWGSMLAIVSDFLRGVADLVLRQEESGSGEEYPRVTLQITENVRLPKEEMEKIMRRNRKEANNNGPQMAMKRRMAAMQAIEKVKLDDCGREAESCGVCLMDMSGVGSEVVGRLPCSHYAHQSCMLKWLVINNSCPFCRHEITKIPTTEPYWLR